MAVAVSTAALAAEVPSAIVGNYVGKACPKGKLTCVPTGKSDRVQISRGKDGRPHVKLRIVFDRGQSCSLEGDAEWNAPKLALALPGVDADKPCHLTLTVRGSDLELADQNLYCREV